MRWTVSEELRGLSRDDLEKAKTLIKTHIGDKGQKDLSMLSPRSRNFVFTMRMHYLNSLERNRPFFCSEKQFNYLNDCVAAIVNYEIGCYKGKEANA